MIQVYYGLDMHLRPLECRVLGRAGGEVVRRDPGPWRRSPDAAARRSNSRREVGVTLPSVSLLCPTPVVPSKRPHPHPHLGRVLPLFHANGSARARLPLLRRTRPGRPPVPPPRVSGPGLPLGTPVQTGPELRQSFRFTQTL